MTPHHTSTETLIAALRILADEVESSDGVANMVLAEAANRLEEMTRRIAVLKSQLSDGVN